MDDYKNYIYEKASKVKTKKDLDALLKEVINNKELDYSDIVYAICACMNATMNYVNNNAIKGNITGFQAGHIGWEMVREYLVRNNKSGLRIINYDDLLYPQCGYRFEKTIDSETWEKIQQMAKENLRTMNGADLAVKSHWRLISEGFVPFGFIIKD